MATLTPLFTGAYSGDMLYNAVIFPVTDFENYIESFSIQYNSLFDFNSTGFDSTYYNLNQAPYSNVVATINVMLVGDLPLHLMQQFTQLSKAVLGSGLSLKYEDDFATERIYYCKWTNAGDFVENTEVYGGATLELKVYYSIDLSYLYVYEGSGDIYVYPSNDALTF